ncbi:MAG: hypothetical protein P1U40_13345 [Coxiellaceae bacterium]|nr:hypothetical protein [Coxiellaceae bacterium]
MKRFSMAVLSAVAGCILAGSVLAGDPLLEMTCTGAQLKQANFCSQDLSNMNDRSVACFAKVAVNGCIQMKTKIPLPGSCNWSFIKGNLHRGSVGFRCSFEKRYATAAGLSDADANTIYSNCVNYQNQAITAVANGGCGF